MFGKDGNRKRNLTAVLASLAIVAGGLTLAFAAGEEAAEPAEPALSVEEQALFDELMTEGAQVFAANCAACHGAEGSESLATHVEILAGNSRAVGNASRVMRRIVHGGTYMPPFGAVLDDRQVAAVATFVRNSWGNDHGMITEEEVAAIR